jgi:outer membrane receptor protein involved in Fe transport
LSIDAALFYSDYTDYQIYGLARPPAPPVAIYSNAGSAKIKGVEWAFNWRVVDGWSLSFNTSYVDSEFYEINARSTAYAVGDPLDLFPKYSFTVSTVRDFDWNGRRGFARVDYNQHGRSTYRNRSSGPWVFYESDVINMLNFNLSLQWNDTLSLGLFAQNLLNDRGYIDVSSSDGSSRTRPRTVGIEFGVAFD